jgi:hypothetical protein
VKDFFIKDLSFEDEGNQRNVGTIMKTFRWLYFYFILKYKYLFIFSEQKKRPTQAVYLYI